MNRLLVVRLGSLGDLVHALPAVAAIRRAHPAAEIDWLVDKVHVEFLSLVPILSSIIALEGRTAGAWLAARKQLRARRYDAAIDFQGLIKSAALARLSGAARVIGFDRPALREGAAELLYTESVPVGEGRHVIQKNLRLASALGAEVGALEFPIRSTESESQALPDLNSRGVSNFALINPGAAWPNKRWPPASFAEVSRQLFERHGIQSVVLWGPGEQNVAREIVERASSGARHAALGSRDGEGGVPAVEAPPTTLTDLVALSRAAKLMVSGDTGPLHIAAAVGTPVVAIFGPTDPHRNGPWHERDIAIARYDRCDCHYERRCRHDDPRQWCLAAITPDEISAAIDRRLA